MKLPALPERYSYESSYSFGARMLFFVDKPKRRLDFSGKDGSVTTAIVRPDKGVQWMRIGNSAWIESRLHEDWEKPRETGEGSDWLETENDLIDGVECRCFIRRADSVGKIMDIVYLDATRNLPKLRIQYDENGSEIGKIRFEKFSLEPPDAAVFELPEGSAVRPL